MASRIPDHEKRCEASVRVAVPDERLGAGVDVLAVECDRNRNDHGGLHGVVLVVDVVEADGTPTGSLVALDVTWRAATHEDVGAEGRAS